LSASKRASTSSDKVDNQHDDRDNQQKVDHASRNVQAEAENPKSQNDYKQCPKHIVLLNFNFFWIAGAENPSDLLRLQM
jgi:hypothetical protein